jgi:hypothetical protein
MAGRERRSAVTGVGDGRFVETLIPGNCQAERQSSVAVVVAGAAQPDQLRGDRVDAVEAYDGGLPVGQRLPQREGGADAVGDAR